MSATPPPISADHKRHANFAKRFLNFFCSFGLATTLFILLLILTLLGTLEQVEHGLFETTRKYFDSFFFDNIDLGCCLRALHLPHKDALLLYLPFRIPFPGGLLLMSILFVNLTMGAVLRIRRSWKNFGVILSHFSILFMLVAGLVSLCFKTEGNMALAPGQTTDEFQSFNKSVIEIQRVMPPPVAGKDSILVIDGNEFSDLTEGKGRVFTNKDLPFDLEVMNYEINAVVPRVKPEENRTMQVDGYYIQPEPRELEEEKNFDAAYVKVIDKKTKEEQTGIVWRVNAEPYSVKVGDEVYSIDLTRRKWRLPFAMRLDKFEQEFHPGTGRPRKFTSWVTRIGASGGEDKKVITMNSPYREASKNFWEGNYALFQHSFNQVQSENGPVRSVLEVVRNPSDQWPLYALFAAMLGLLIHMSGRLYRFLVRSAHRPPAPSTLPPVKPV